MRMQLVKGVVKKKKKSQEQCLADTLRLKKSWELSPKGSEGAIKEVVIRQWDA
jgi:hypothetical protein